MIQVEKRSVRCRDKCCKDAGIIAPRPRRQHEKIFVMLSRIELVNRF
jgi:hypothetical protein